MVNRRTISFTLVLALAGVLLLLQSSFVAAKGRSEDPRMADDGRGTAGVHRRNATRP